MVAAASGTRRGRSVAESGVGAGNDGDGHLVSSSECRGTPLPRFVCGSCSVPLRDVLAAGLWFSAFFSAKRRRGAYCVDHPWFQTGAGGRGAVVGTSALLEAAR